MAGHKYAGGHSGRHSENPLHSGGYNRNDSFAPPQADFGETYGDQEVTECNEENPVEEIIGESPEDSLDGGER